MVRSQLAVWTWSTVIPVGAQLRQAGMLSETLTQSLIERRVVALDVLSPFGARAEAACAYKQVASIDEERRPVHMRFTKKGSPRRGPDQSARANQELRPDPHIVRE